MKKLVLLFSFSILTVVAFAQMANPVTWTFSSKKIDDNIYEVSMVASIQAGWHLYSQSQPKDAIAQPTTFTFTNNPLVELKGKVSEWGKIEKFTDKELGISANQYSKQVVFTQKVKMKGKAKSNITGTVTFQTCDDKKCLPPKTISYNIALK